MSLLRTAIAMLPLLSFAAMADGLEQAYAKLNPQNYDRYRQPVTYLLAVACQSDSLRMLEKSVKNGELEMPEADRRFLSESIDIHHEYAASQVAMVKGVMTGKENEEFSSMVKDSAAARQSALQNGQFPEAIDYQRDCVRTSEAIGKKFDAVISGRLKK